VNRVADMPPARAGARGRAMARPPRRSREGRDGNVQRPQERARGGERPLKILTVGGVTPPMKTACQGDPPRGEANIKGLRMRSPVAGFPSP
jgi:hypothetical protein